MDKQTVSILLVSAIVGFVAVSVLKKKKAAMGWSIGELTVV